MVLENKYKNQYLDIPEYLTNNSDRTNKIKLSIKKKYLFIIFVFYF